MTVCDMMAETINKVLETRLTGEMIAEHLVQHLSDQQIDRIRDGDQGEIASLVLLPVWKTVKRAVQHEDMRQKWKHCGAISQWIDKVLGVKVTKNEVHDYLHSWFVKTSSLSMALVGDPGIMAQLQETKEWRQLTDDKSRQSISDDCKMISANIWVEFQKNVTPREVRDHLYEWLLTNDLLREAVRGSFDKIVESENWKQLTEDTSHSEVTVTSKKTKTYTGDRPKTAADKIKLAMWFIAKFDSPEEATKVLRAAVAAAKELES